MFSSASRAFAFFVKLQDIKIKFSSRSSGSFLFNYAFLEILTRLAGFYWLHQLLEKDQRQILPEKEEESEGEQSHTVYTSEKKMEQNQRQIWMKRKQNQRQIWMKIENNQRQIRMKTEQKETSIRDKNGQKTMRVWKLS